MRTVLFSLFFILNFQGSYAVASENPPVKSCHFLSDAPVALYIRFDPKQSCYSMEVVSGKESEGYTCNETKTVIMSSSEISKDDNIKYILKLSGINLGDVKSLTAHLVSVDDDGGSYFLIETQTASALKRNAGITYMGGIKVFNCIENK